MSQISLTVEWFKAKPKANWGDVALLETKLNIVETCTQVLFTGTLTDWDE